MHEGAFDWGKKTVVQVIKGMDSKLLALDAAAERAARVIEDNLRVSSPARKGPLSEGGGPEGWGAYGGKLYAAGWREAAQGATGIALPASRLAGSAAMAPMAAAGTTAAGGRSGPIVLQLVADTRVLAQALVPHIDAIGFYELQRAAPTIGRV
jgi:hypothetical protein